MEKSPGLDEMTVEVLTACWNFLEHDCLQMIKDYKRNGTLPCNFTTDVMKVIPKKMDKRRLKDWQPLTMLMIIYKLIASVLAMRLSHVSKSLINPQQTSVILGRSILENISLVWMTIERVIQ